MEEGNEIGNYRICEQIGHGAYADVYKGIHKQTQQNVAIKIINLSLISDEDEVCLAREVATLLQVDHPNIVFTYEYINDGSHLYIFSELISNCMMLDKINDMHGLPEKMARKYFNDILSAVTYLHKSRLIVHRDIKLQNILIEKNGSAKLIDFGFCNSHHFIKSFNSFVGTPGFTAPEIIDSVGYDESCDIFSLGVCLYAMVVGKTPYQMQNEDSKLLRAQIEELNYPESLSEPLKDLLKRMMVGDPAKRIKIEDIIRHPWVRMDGYSTERFEYRKFPIDLGGCTTIDSLENVRRKPQLFLNKSILHILTNAGMDCKKVSSDVKRGAITPESAAYFIAVRNNMGIEEVPIITSSRKHTVNSCPSSASKYKNSGLSVPCYGPAHGLRKDAKAKLPQLKVPRHATAGSHLPTPSGIYPKKYRY